MNETNKRFRFYRGYPVKRMRRAPEGILLTLLDASPGRPGIQICTSQQNWERFGEWRILESTQIAFVRQLVPGDLRDAIGEGDRDYADIRRKAFRDASTDGG